MIEYFFTFKKIILEPPIISTEFKMFMAIAALLAFQCYNTNAFTINPSSRRDAIGTTFLRNNQRILSNHDRLSLRLGASVMNSTETSPQELYNYRQQLDSSRIINNNPIVNKKKEVVMKFGGSSLATHERIDHVAHLIKDQIALGCRPRAIVCSAMGKTTNLLLAAGDMALGTL